MILLLLKCVVGHNGVLNVAELLECGGIDQAKINSNVAEDLIGKVQWRLSSVSTCDIYTSYVSFVAARIHGM